MPWFSPIQIITIKSDRRLTIPNAPTETSPPYCVMLRVTVTATRQAHRLMRNGGKPISNDSLTILRCNRMSLRSKWIKSLLLENKRICHISMMVCALIVAAAAPRMPQSNTKIKIGAKIQLIITVPKVAYMALRGRLVDRNKAFSPK